MKNLQFTIVIEKDPTTNLFIGYVPGMVGAHSQGETIDELKSNLKDVIGLCIQEGDPFIVGEYIGTDQLEVII